jgi:hypothetical protein
MSGSKCFKCPNRSNQSEFSQTLNFSRFRLTLIPYLEGLVAQREENQGGGTCYIQRGT